MQIAFYSCYISLDVVVVIVVVEWSSSTIHPHIFSPPQKHLMIDEESMRHLEIRLYFTLLHFMFDFFVC